MNKPTLHLSLLTIAVFCTSILYGAAPSPMFSASLIEAIDRYTRPAKYDRDREHPIAHQLASLVLDDQVDAMGEATSVQPDALRTFIVQRIHVTKETFNRYEQDLTEQQKHNAHQNALTLALRLKPHAYNLSNLYLQNLNLTTCPAEICELINLERLNLEDNKLTTLPEDICRLSNLEVLNIDDNRLSELPSSMSMLISLRTFSAKNNRFTKIPDEIFPLRNLTFLGFDDNKISVIPAAISMLTQLGHLCLNGNELETLPPELFDLLELRHLSLSNNRKLKELPEAVAQLTKLKCLYTYGNQLTTLPLDALVRLGKRRSSYENGLQTHAYDNPFSPEYIAQVYNLVMATGAYITCCRQHIADFDHIIYDGIP